MAKGCYTLREGRDPMVRMYCADCHRFAQFRRAGLIERFGPDFPMPTLLRKLKPCRIGDGLSGPQCQLAYFDRLMPERQAAAIARGGLPSGLAGRLAFAAELNVTKDPRAPQHHPFPGLDQMTANPDEDDDVDPNAEMYRQWAEADLRDKESREAIGEFIHEFSQLEFTIKFLIANYANLSDDVFHIMLGDVDFHRLCSMLSALVKLKMSNDLPRREKLEGLIAEVRSINADRVRCWVSPNNASVQIGSAGNLAITLPRTCVPSARRSA